MNHDLAKTDVKATFAEKDGTFLVTLYPGEPRTLVFTPKMPGLTLDAFKKAFSVTHLRETYR